MSPIPVQETGDKRYNTQKQEANFLRYSMIECELYTCVAAWAAMEGGPGLNAGLHMAGIEMFGTWDMCGQVANQ